MNKLILDACCGSRMFWFDKNNPFVLFQDIRELETELCDGRKLEVKPDVIGDFTDMKYADNTFKITVFDPPQIKGAGKNSFMALKYGSLDENWRPLIKKGFDECMRVTDLYGVVIFKWNETSIPLSEILKVIDCQPLFGHTSGRQSKTIWLCFMKLKSL